MFIVSLFQKKPLTPKKPFIFYCLSGIFSLWPYLLYLLYTENTVLDDVHPESLTCHSYQSRTGKEHLCLETFCLLKDELNKDQSLSACLSLSSLIFFFFIVEDNYRAKCFEILFWKLILRVKLEFSKRTLPKRTYF